MSDKNSEKTMIWLFGALAAHLFAAIVLLGVLLRIVPQYAEFFSYFEMSFRRLGQPDTASVTVIGLSRWIAENLWVAVPLLGTDVAILFFLGRLGERPRWLADVWVVCVLLAVILVMSFVMASLAETPISWMQDRVT